MIKFLHLGAAIATVLSTQFSDILISPANAASSLKAGTSNLVFTESIPNVRTAPNNTPQATYLDPTKILLGIAIVGSGAVVIGLSAKDKSLFKPSLTSDNAIRLDQAKSQLKKKLLGMLHGDRATANRLLSLVQIKNPHRSINWYVEKVIYDLERDRGRY